MIKKIKPCPFDGLSEAPALLDSKLCHLNSNLNENYVCKNINYYNDVSLCINNNFVHNFVYENFNNLNFINYNSFNLKNNSSYIQFLMEDFLIDFFFICETWLLESEVPKFLNTLSHNYNTYHKSSMDIKPRNGRPFGGSAFIIHKKIKVIDYMFLNKNICYINIEIWGKKFCIIGVYMPYDNNSYFNLSEF